MEQDHAGMAETIWERMELYATDRILIWVAAKVGRAVK